MQGMSCWMEWNVCESPQKILEPDQNAGMSSILLFFGEPDSNHAGSSRSACETHGQDAGFFMTYTVMPDSKMFLHASKILRCSCMPDSKMFLHASRILRCSCISCIQKAMPESHRQPKDSLHLLASSLPSCHRILSVGRGVFVRREGVCQAKFICGHLQEQGAHVQHF